MSVIFGFIVAFVLFLVWIVSSISYFFVQFLASAALFLVRFNPAAEDIVKYITPIWQVVVNMANLFLLGGFVYMGVGLIIGNSAVRGKINEFLTGLITVAVLANFSLAMSSTAVNLTQTVGDLFVAAVVIPIDGNVKIAFDPNLSADTDTKSKEIGKTNDIFVKGILDPFSKISGIRKNVPVSDSKPEDKNKWFTSVIEYLGSKISDPNTLITDLFLEALFIASLWFLLLAFWSSFKIAIFRLGWLIILMVSSPIALISAFSPITFLKQLGDAWVKKFISIAPIYPFFIIGLYFAAYIATAFNNLAPKSIDFGKAIGDIITGIFGNSDKSVGAIGYLIVQIITVFIGPAISVIIILELTKYLDKQFAEHAKEFVDKAKVTAKTLYNGAKMFGNGAKKFGEVVAGTWAGGKGLFDGKGKGRLNYQGAVRGYLAGAEQASKRLDFGKRIKDKWNRDTVFGADQKEKNKSIAERDSDLAMRMNGKHELADRSYPNSPYSGLTKTDILRKQAKGEDLFAQNEYAANEVMYKKQGRMLSGQGNVARLERLEEELKNPNFNYSNLSDLDRHQVDGILETAKTDKEHARKINSNPKLSEFFAKNAAKIASNMGDPNKVMGMLKAVPSVGLRVEDEDIFEGKEVKKAVMESIYDDPVAFDNTALERDLDTAAAIKDSKNIEGYLQFKKSSKAKKTFVPSAPKKLTKDELANKTEEEKEEYQKIKEEYNSYKNKDGDWLDKNAAKIGKLAAEKAGKGKAVTQDHIKKAAIEYINDESNGFANSETGYKKEYAEKIFEDINSADSEIAFTIENQINNNKTQAQLDRENNATMVEQLRNAPPETIESLNNIKGSQDSSVLSQNQTTRFITDVTPDQLKAATAPMDNDPHFRIKK